MMSSSSRLVQLQTSKSLDLPPPNDIGLGHASTHWFTHTLPSAFPTQRSCSPTSLDSLVRSLDLKHSQMIQHQSSLTSICSPLNQPRMVLGPRTLPSLHSARDLVWKSRSNRQVKEDLQGELFTDTETRSFHPRVLLCMMAYHS